MCETNIAQFPRPVHHRIPNFLNAEVEAEPRAVPRAAPRCTRVEFACCKRLKLCHDEPLSNVAFNFNLRRHTEAAAQKLASLDCFKAAQCIKVGNWRTRFNIGSTHACLLSTLPVLETQNMKSRLEPLVST